MDVLRLEGELLELSALLHLCSFNAALPEEAVLTSACGEDALLASRLVLELDECARTCGGFANPGSAAELSCGQLDLHSLLGCLVEHLEEGLTARPQLPLLSDDQCEAVARRYANNLLLICLLLPDLQLGEAGLVAIAWEVVTSRFSLVPNGVVLEHDHDGLGRAGDEPHLAI